MEFDVDGYGKGTINPVTMRDGDFVLSFRKASKEYDGTPDVHMRRSISTRRRATHRVPLVARHRRLPSRMTTMCRLTGKYDNKNAGDPTVHHKVKISNKNSISVHGTASFKGMVTDISTSAN